MSTRGTILLIGDGFTEVGIAELGWERGEKGREVSRGVLNYDTWVS